MAASTICILYILIEFSCNKKVRYIPSRLMISRAIFNYIAVFVVLITIQNQTIITHPRHCEAQGAIFLFSLYMATIYYALICWELYLTLKNPFRSPSSGSILFHLCTTLTCFTVIIFLAAFSKFQYRPAFQVCFLDYDEGEINLLNWFIIYIPVCGICVGGLIATVWSVQRLKTTIIDETFELRWLLIKQQTVIITLFTLNYILQGINWSILFWFNDEDKKPKLNPYLLTAFCMIAVIFDALTWIIRKYIKQIYNFSSHPAAKRLKGAQGMKNISDALRKEVITCIVDGLSQTLTINIAADSRHRTETACTESELVPINSLNYSVSDQLIDGETINYYQSIEESGETLTRFHFPNKIDGKCMQNVIEEYKIDPMNTNKHLEGVIFRDYGAKVFGYLRRNIYKIDGDEYYKSILPHGDIAKISLELTAKFSEGRSGAFFFYTKDMKYLIKTLTKREAQLLLDCLQRYVNYMKHNKETFLCKYFGLHSITLYGHCIYFVVNKNIFCVLDRAEDEIYDIKGSWIDRNTKHNITDRKLMKDEDLHKILLLNKNKSYAIYKQLEKDTIFLSQLNIMDYSLLLGVYYEKIKTENNKTGNEQMIDLEDKEEELKHNDDTQEILEAEYIEGAGKYCIGIIDMLQAWNFNKKVERFIKSYVRCKDKNGISCVPPIPYKNRFLNKMIEIGIGHKVKSRQSTLISISAN